MSHSNKNLGPLEKSWLPGRLLSDAWAGRNLPTWFMPIQTGATFISLFFCAWAAKLVLDHLFPLMGLAPNFFWGLLVFAALFVIPMVLLHWVGQLLVNRNELAVYENGIRWASNVILFEQIDSLSMGTETFREKHFPTLNVLMKAHWRHGEGVKKAEELEKASTLAFNLKDGDVTQWRNFSRCFGPEDLDEFFLKVGERIGN